MKKKYNIFTNKLLPNDIYLIVLHQSDNHQSHAVCISNGFIFDCNATNALPFTKEGLDCCCGKDAYFVGVSQCYLLGAKKTMRDYTN